MCTASAPRPRSPGRRAQRRPTRHRRRSKEPDARSAPCGVPPLPPRPFGLPGHRHRAAPAGPAGSRAGRVALRRSPSRCRRETGAGPGRRGPAPRLTPTCRFRRGRAAPPRTAARSAPPHRPTRSLRPPRRSRPARRVTHSPAATPEPPTAPQLPHRPVPRPPLLGKTHPGGLGAWPRLRPVRSPAVDHTAAGSADPVCQPDRYRGSAPRLCQDHAATATRPVPAPPANSTHRPTPAPTAPRAAGALAAPGPSQSPTLESPHSLAATPPDSERSHARSPDATDHRSGSPYRPTTVAASAGSAA